MGVHFLAGLVISGLHLMQRVMKCSSATLAFRSLFLHLYSPETNLVKAVGGLYESTCSGALVTSIVKCIMLRHVSA